MVRRCDGRNTPSHGDRSGGIGEGFQLRVAVFDQSAEGFELLRAGHFAPFEGDGFGGRDNHAGGFHSSKALSVIVRMTAADGVGGEEDSDTL